MATTPPFKYQPMFEHGEDKNGGVVAKITRKLN